MSLGDFARRINILARDVDKNINDTVKRCALAIDQTVVLATPVDTGRARSNWRVSLGEPIRTVIEPYSPLTGGSDPSKIGENSNATAALAQGREVISRRKPEQEIYISNNVNYIERLNAGWSAQAEAGFVQQAIIDGAAAILSSKVVL